MNENRSLFALDGITGMLIATVLLLTILVVLTIFSLGTQNANAANYYDIKDEQSIKMFGSKIEDHVVTVGSK
ncbi:MAG: DUF4006 family protein [Sulfurimonas sp.]|nr:DUF4006 family protein [Sulfurimonas sp.]